MLELKDVSFAYYSRGLSIVPISMNGSDKKPLLEWQRWQTQHQTKEEFDDLPFEKANAFGVICGQKLNNGLFLGVVDFDLKNLEERVIEKGRRALKELPVTQNEETPSKGQHWIYYSNVKPKSVSVYHGEAALELIGQGKLCIMAPSQGYKLLNDKTPTVVQDLNTIFLRSLEKAGIETRVQQTSWFNREDISRRAYRAEDPPCILRLSQGTSEGQRNEWAIRLASYYLNFRKLRLYNALNTLKKWNSRNSPPMLDNELEEVCKSARDGEYVYGCSDQILRNFCNVDKCRFAPKIASTPLAAEDPTDSKEGADNESSASNPRSEHDSQATALIQMCLGNEEITLFHDQHNTPFARIVQECGTSILPINSRHFKYWLAGLFWESEDSAPKNDALNSAATILSARAIYEGEQFDLYNRIAPGLTEKEVYIDLCECRGRAIRVTAKGWEIVEHPPILFKRFSHQQPLPLPERNGDPWKLLEFLNIKEDDESTKLILLCTAISYLIPEIPHPILVIYGPQGSGKSLFFVVLRSMIDPSAVIMMTIARGDRELIQQLDHHWFSVYDNVSILPEWVSDILCRAVTGGGFTKRELYTDDSDITYKFKRCVGLNGINIAAQKADLLDRAILICMPHIPEDKRREERAMLEGFDSCKASIFGGFWTLWSGQCNCILRLSPGSSSGWLILRGGERRLQ